MRKHLQHQFHIWLQFPKLFYFSPADNDLSWTERAPSTPGPCLLTFWNKYYCYSLTNMLITLWKYGNVHWSAFLPTGNDEQSASELLIVYLGSWHLSFFLLKIYTSGVQLEILIVFLPHSSPISQHIPAEQKWQPQERRLAWSTWNAHQTPEAGATILLHLLSISAAVGLLPHRRAGAVIWCVSSSEYLTSIWIAIYQTR